MTNRELQKQLRKMLRIGILTVQEQDIIVEAIRQLQEYDAEQTRKAKEAQ